MIISDVVKSVIQRVLDMLNGRAEDDGTFVFLAQVQLDTETGDIVGLYPMLRENENDTIQFVKLMRFSEKCGGFRFWRGEKFGSIRGISTKSEMESLLEKENSINE